MISLSAEQLRRAASIKDEIESLETELDRLLQSSGAATPGKRGRKRMSAAGRAAIAAAQKLRWAKAKGKAGKSTSKGRRKMSVGARKKIAAAARARWKKAKAAGKNSL